MFTTDEQLEKMNMPAWARRVIDALDGHGVQVRRVEQPPPDAQYDLVLELTARGASRTYSVVLKDRVTVASLSVLSSRLPGKTLLIAPHITSKQSEECRRLGLAYADSAGNVFLSWDQVLIDIEGRRPSTPDRPSVPTRPLRAFRPSGLQVLFSLLSDLGLSSQPYREVASVSGASLGTVQLVMAELIDLNYVEVDGRQRRTHRLQELFDKWVEAYALNLSPSLTLGRYVGDRIHTHVDPETPVEKFAAQWGGESAAALQGQYLRPATLVLYASETPAKLLSTWRLQKAESGGNVIVRRRFWNPSSFRGPIVPSTLVYADLVASGDPRQVEAAQRLKENDALLRRINEH